VRFSGAAFSGLTSFTSGQKPQPRWASVCIHWLALGLNADVTAAVASIVLVVLRMAFTTFGLDIPRTGSIGAVPTSVLSSFARLRISA
jgi:hypothetical protein